MKFSGPSKTIHGAILILSFALHASSANAGGIAVIDTQRAVMETEDGLRAQASLKKFFNSRQKELDRKQKSLRKEREDIDKQAKVLSKQALQKRIETWQAEMVTIQSTFVDYNKELQKKQAEITQPILRKVMGIVRRVASSGGYDIVVDKQAVPYVRSDLDLTDRGITAYNRGGVIDTPTVTTPDPKPAAPKK